VSSTITTRILKLPLRWLAGALAAIALAISAMFHGLAAVAPASNVSAVGTVIAAGPWDVTVSKACVVKSQDGLDTLKPGDRWFAVIVIVDVTAAASRDDMADIVRLPHVSGLAAAAPDRILVTRDETDLGYLNPGMPERLALLWEQAPKVPIPHTVDVAVYAKTLRANSLGGSTTQGNLDWFDAGLKSTVVAPVLAKCA
jgi:hypothetical protein